MNEDGHIPPSEEVTAYTRYRDAIEDTFTELEHSMRSRQARDATRLAAARRGELIPALGYVSAPVTKPLSMEAQRRAIQLWAEQTGHAIVGWVEDVRVFSMARQVTGLDELVARVGLGEAKVVAVAGFSRLSRSAETVTEFSERLTGAGGRVESAEAFLVE